jgi:DNA-binding SARP family transcriptional activator
MSRARFPGDRGELAKQDPAPAHSPRAGLRVWLFGSVRVEHEAHNGDVSLTPSVQALLAYLLLNRGRSVPRDVLAGVFWGEVPERRSRRCLNTALWRLRQALEPQGVTSGAYLIRTPGHGIAFNQESDFWLDVQDFEDAVLVTRYSPESVEAHRIERLDEALRGYHADLLDGIYDEWALAERDRLRELYLNSLAWLMRCQEETGAWRQAIDCGLRVLQRDPLRESVHRSLMRSYLASGRPAAAVRQFESCRSVLASELGIPPSEETMELYRHIRAAGFAGGSTSSVSADVVGSALRELELMLRALNEARDRLNRVIPLMRDAGDKRPARPATSRTKTKM